MFNYHISIELPKAEKQFTEAYRDSNSILRWKSNNSVPMADTLGFWVELGLITSEDAKACKAARNADTDAFFSKHRSSEASFEEISEMRSCFGKGSTVVDVISGRKIRL